MWVANEAEGTLSLIQPGESTVSTTVIGSTPQSLAAVGGELWICPRTGDVARGRNAETGFGSVGRLARLDGHI